MASTRGSDSKRTSSWKRGGGGGVLTGSNTMVIHLTYISPNSILLDPIFDSGIKAECSGSLD